eukprot:g1502.t1
MSAVKLTGDWAVATARNREVLLSLNESSWACHFTTTANLTACGSEGSLWNTFTKNASDPSGGSFVRKLGFLGAGADAKAAANVTVAACMSTCTALGSACAGVTFQTSNSAGDTPPATATVKCYWKNAVHFTAQSKMGNCLTPGGAGKPLCAPLPGEMGLGGYYGHYQGHWLSATSFLINATGDAAVRARAESAIAILEGVMEAWKGKYGDDLGDGYLFPFDPVVWDRLLSVGNSRPWYSVPFYTLHKLMAGLLDQHLFAGSSKALSLLLRMAGWVHRRVEATIAAGGEALWQHW